MKKIKKIAVTALAVCMMFVLAGCSSNAGTTTDSKNVKAETGDTVVIDFTGYLDGKEFEGGSATNYFVELGSNTFIDTFEEQITGHKVGDQFDVNVTFPNTYFKEDLQNKDVVFKVTLHEIWKKAASDLD